MHFRERLRNHNPHHEDLAPDLEVIRADLALSSKRLVQGLR
jgi:hypothetical protein